MTSKEFDLASAVVFDNAAAGHDGILSDPTGALIYKPCTPGEVAFYQSTAIEHPEFTKFMPTFMGTLQRGPSKQLQDTLAAGQKQNVDTSSSMVLPTPELAVVSANVDKDGNLLKGKKLETDLIVVMENVLSGFKRPNFMDIKLGKRLWDDDAAPSKRTKLDDVAAVTTSGSLGLRIAGMQVWEPSSGRNIAKTEVEHTTLKEAPNLSSSSDTGGRYRAYDKMYGRVLTKDNINDAFQALLLTGSDDFTERYLEDIIRDIDSSIGEVESILANTESRMYSASILLVYEGDAATRKEIINKAVARATRESESRPEDSHRDRDAEAEDEDSDAEDEEDKKLFDAKVIDFAHAAWTPGKGPDENFLHGVRNVRKIVQGLKKSSNKST